MPSIVDAMPSGAMAAMLADPAQRARHVDALARFAEEGSYAGLDIDYEKFAFADDRSTWDTTRPAWVAFVTALAERLHTDGRTLTVSIPPIYDAGRTSYSGTPRTSLEGSPVASTAPSMASCTHANGAMGPGASVE